MKDIDFGKQPAAEREWQAQERGEGPYAAVARVASQADAPALPPDFAERVATMAQVRRKALQQPARLEAWLIGTLLVALVVGGAVFIALDVRSLDGLRQPWLIGLAACLAISQGAAWLLRPAHRRG
ncbi:hypothetical protein L2Y96_02325 [Luteibacter aegosomaticola]|uniref:hypothetical protein n=1 Tax=Luteibacter aegosomaticola TaxID=2911538 RepID=UPI001FFB8B0C|nr:hypothetical protein [Luteibacter aegosomaticola]UPG90631.1 hypothetical protein L2Y96_02325 [Luteibacter aegosomaticola]